MHAQHYVVINSSYTVQTKLCINQLIKIRCVCLAHQVHKKKVHNFNSQDGSTKSEYHTLQYTHIDAHPHIKKLNREMSGILQD